MRRYKINAIVIIPIAIITFLSGFAWGVRTEKDIQKVVALEPTLSPTATPVPTTESAFIPIVTPKVLPPIEPIHTVEPVKSEIYKATAYCSCTKCCGKSDGITASGEVAEEGVTIAADWKVLPKGTKVEIKGIGTRTVQDRGGAIKGKRIDIYFDNHEAALEFGVQDVELTVKGD